MAEGRDEAVALRVTGLTKSFGAKRVLDGIDLVVRKGAVTAVLGPSGCGKTTLLRIIAGFDHPDAGSIEIDGTVVASAGTFVVPERRRVGVVPQEGALFPHLTVGGNVGFGLPRGAERKRRVREVLELVGLPGFEKRRPHELSGGQQHRVALARALAPQPSIVVLDEPFSSLDTGLRGQVRADVLEALRASGATAVLVTHDQLEALSVADEVAVLLGGRMAQTADPATLYDDPANLEVATFVGDAVVLGGVRRGDRAECAIGSVAVRSGSPVADGPVTVVLRPEQLDVVAADRPDGTPGVVVASSYFGHDALVTICLHDATHVRARLHATAVPAVGAAVGVVVDAPAVVFPA